MGKGRQGILSVPSSRRSKQSKERKESYMLRSSYKPYLMVILAVSIFAAFTFVASANHSWNGYHWARTSNPFTLKLGDNVSSAWDPILATTSSDWSQSTVLNTTIVAGGTSPRSCRP